MLDRLLSLFRPAPRAPAPDVTPLLAPLKGPPPAAVLVGAGPRGTVGVQSRAWRNRNPGNLRPPSKWRPAGLVGRDERPGGPFCIFGTERDGWEALARRIVQLHREGSRTPRAIIARWAPPTENNTAAYIAGVARQLGVEPDDPVDVRKLDVMTRIADAIRWHEGIARDPAWDPDAKTAGLIAGIQVESGA